MSKYIILSLLICTSINNETINQGEPVKLTQDGIDLIKSYEKLRLKAYPDPKTHGAPWTIGYGHTGSDVTPDMEITEEEAEQLLIKDLEDACKYTKYLFKAPLTDNQFSALVSLVYNCGVGHIQHSSLPAKINGGDLTSAADTLLTFNSPGTSVEKGLTIRRQREREMFLQDVTTVASNE